jgi:hypothetical protein
MTTIRREDAGATAAPASDYDVGAAFDEHDIEWWVYDGTQLVPAPPAQAELFSRLHDRPPRQLVQRGRWHGIMSRLPLPHARTS